MTILRHTYTVPPHLDAKQVLAWLVALRNTIQFPATLIIDSEDAGNTINVVHDDLDTVQDLDLFIDGWASGMDIHIDGEVENKGTN